MLGTKLKSLRIKNFLFSFSTQNVFFYYSLISTYPPHRHQAGTSSVNVASSYAHLRFYQILTIFGSLTIFEFFTSEDLFAWEEKKIETVLDP